MIKSSLALLKISFKDNKTIKSWTAKVIALELLSVFMLYQLNSIYGKLYQGIETRDTNLIWTSMAYFTGIAMVLVFINGTMGAYINRLSFEIRTGLTKYALRTHIYYTSEMTLPLNIDQRIQEDIRKFGDSSVDLATGVFKALIKLPVFLGVVISLTHWYTGLIILVTVILGTYLTRVVGKRLVALQSTQETYEAEFRLAIRGNVGTIILNAWRRLSAQFLEVNKRLKLLTFTQSGLGQVFVLLPFIVLMPLYLAHTLEMGAFFQSVNALGKVIDSLTILIDSRQTMVAIETSSNRLSFLKD